MNANRGLGISQVIEDVADNYDVVIIDCPPQLGYLTLSALTAATSILVTVHPQMLDVMSMNQFLAMTSNLLREIENAGAKFNFNWMRYLITRFEEVEAKRWDEVGIEQENASNAVAGHEALSAEDLALMNRDGLSLHVAGRAETGTVSKSFEWSFRGRVAFSACQAEGENLGVLVLAGETATVQFTVHGDHLFYDSLKSDAVLRFATLAAADTDRDGAVSLEELEAVDLTTLPADRYETAGDGSITHLRGLVQAQALTLVHFQGEGHCRAAPR